MAIGVCIERGSRRVFASAVDWPGWCRSGKTEDQALEALATYLARYEPVASGAGFPIPKRGATRFEILERARGNATTDFGAPAIIAKADRRSTTRREGGRLATLVSACWRTLEDVAVGAPATLRKGPRGGGRDRDAIVEHVAGAEVAYAGKLGLKGLKDPGELRPALVDLLSETSDGRPPVPKGWPPRYVARRVAWHALDHAWEIQDRST